MKTILIILISLFTLFIIYWTNTHWTEKQKNEFSENCSNTETINDLSFSFTGFSYNEIENVKVNQIHGGKIIDSFYVQPNKNTFDSIRTRYWASSTKLFYIKDTYQFIIKGNPPFILSDMKMIMWSQFTMFSEGYGCVMGDYKINGVRFSYDANPDFIKNGFKFPWDK